MNDPEIFAKAALPLKYAGRGWHVFPIFEIAKSGVCSCPSATDCGSPGKHPRIANGFKSATTDPDQIRKWIKRWPGTNWGIACGPSRIAVVDVDPRNQGDDTLASLEKQHGELPKTPTALTGGGGQHYLYAFPEGAEVRTCALGPGIELKASGGYIVAAPSNHISGKRYEWDAGALPSETTLTTLPKWIQKIAGDRNQTEKYEVGGEVTEGFLGACFEIMGWLGRKLGPDKAAAYCPWEHEHSMGARYDSSTVVFAPRKGSRVGWWFCSHGHCQHRKLQDVLKEIPDQAKTQAREKLKMDPLYSPEAEAAKDQEVKTIDASVGEWVRLLRFNMGGQLTKDAGNAALILANLDEWKGTLEYDAFSDRVLWARPVPEITGLTAPKPGDDLSDHHVTYVHHWLAKFRGVSFPKSAVQDALEAAAKAREVHPVRDYIESLKWDGKPRVPTWLSVYLGAEHSEYTCLVGRWWLISAVARVSMPGCQADHLLVFEGEQGVGKSTAVRILAGKWLLSSLPDIQSKDAAQLLQGHWILEIGELDAFRGASGTRVKDWVTRTVDSYRPAYGRFTVRRPRQCVFIGTTNEGSYLSDATGARRFWPVRIGATLREELIRDRDQIWAEAAHYFHAGEDWWPASEWVPEVTRAQESRYQVDEWEQRIAEWVAVDNRDRFKLGEVLSQAIGLEPGKWDRTAQTRAGICLRRLGFHSRQCWEGGVKTRRYERSAPPTDLLTLPTGGGTP